LSFDYLSSGRFYYTRARMHNMQKGERVINCGLCVARRKHYVAEAGKETLLLVSLCVWAQAAHQSCGEIWPYTEL
jgi:hypothetical protein